MRSRSQPTLGKRVAPGAAALASTLVFHALLFLALRLTHGLTPPPPPPREPERVTMRELSPESWEKNRAITEAPSKPSLEPTPRHRRTAPPPPPKAIEKRPEVAVVPAVPVDPEQLPPQALRPPQVVDTAPGNDQVPEAATPFFSETNNRVEHETRSRYHGVPSEHVTAKPIAGKKSPPPPKPERQTEGPSQQAVATQREHRALKREAQTARGPGGERPTDTALALLPQRPDGTFPTAPKSPKSPGTAPDKGSPGSSGTSDQTARAQAGTGTGDPRATTDQRGRREQLALHPSSKVIDKMTEGTPSADDLRGVEEGDGTYLNTKEWKYASYFNRIKRDVASYWMPRVAEVGRQYDPTGELFLYRDRQTNVHVTLDKDGTVQSVRIAAASGAEFLDREAVGAFKRAANFPHPPTTIMDPDGMVRFDFSFIVTGAGPILRRLR